MLVELLIFYQSFSLSVILQKEAVYEKQHIKRTKKTTFKFLISMKLQNILFTK